MRLGPLELSSDLVLAPMMDITTPSFRLLIKHLGGVGLIVTPMVFVSQISAAPKTLGPHLEFIEKQRPCAVQIVASGRNSQQIQDAIEFLESYQFDILDINAGCPAPHTMTSGGGGALLKKGEQGRLISVVEKCLKFSSRPVSLKTRLGYENVTQIRETMQLLHQFPLAFLTLHGRTVKQKYSGDVNLDLIKEIKSNWSIPLVGNGNVKDYLTYKHMKDYTDCDAVMIGRAVMQDPNIFSKIISQINAASQNRAIPIYPRIPTIETLRTYLQQDLLLIEQLSKFWNNPRFKLAELRRLAIWGIKGIRGYRRTREIISKINDFEQLREFIFGPKLLSNLVVGEEDVDGSDEEVLLN
jgi:tRNA-dihydrouridine synthase B